MDKVYLALQSAGLSAEKTKLETDCRDSSAELKRAEVRPSVTCEMLFTMHFISVIDHIFESTNTCKGIFINPVQLLFLYKLSRNIALI